MRVLIIEDEARLVRNLAQVFRETANYAVDISGDGVDGLHLAQTNPYDLVVRGKGRPFRLAWSRQEILGAEADSPAVLNIVVANYCGEIIVTSSRQSGTEFTVTLPLFKASR